MDWNLDEALEYYRRQGAPGDQNALIALLKEIRREEGCIPAAAPGKIADAYGVREALVLALIRRVPSLRLSGGHCAPDPTAERAPTLRITRKKPPPPG